MTVFDVYSKLNEYAPIENKEAWDNCGILAGRKNKKVTRALICLDITQAVIDEAIKKGCDLIVSHHPVIFSKLSEVTDDKVGESRVLSIIENKLSAICMHTNLDVAECGVNTALARACGIENVEYMGDFLYVGEACTTLDGFLKQVSDGLFTKGIKYFKNTDKVNKIGFCSGKGSHLITRAKELGCDTFFTGEMSYHDMEIAQEIGINVVEAGHFYTEFPVCGTLKEWLCQMGVEAVISEVNRDYCEFYVG